MSLKAQAKKTIGLHPSWTKKEAEIKHKLKARFDKEGANVAPKVLWGACHLFVKAKEAQP